MPIIRGSPADPVLCLIMPLSNDAVWCPRRRKIIFEQEQANRRPFLQKQLEICFEAVDTAGRLASVPDPVEWEIARAKFWRLYWGVLSIVENQQVENAMVALGKLIPEQPLSAQEHPMAELQDLSYNLAHSARDLMGPTWNVDLPALQGKGR
jgi:hypothetical protein